jgi:hypothetical protein
LIYLISTFALLQVSILSFFFVALLAANVRATWISAYWATHNPQPPPLPLRETLKDQFDDFLPRVIWPIGQWFYYALTVLMVVGLSSMLLRRH